MTIIFAAAYIYALVRLNISLYEAIVGAGILVCLIYLEYIATVIKNARKAFGVFGNELEKITDDLQRKLKEAEAQK